MHAALQGALLAHWNRVCLPRHTLELVFSRQPSLVQPWRIRWCPSLPSGNSQCRLQSNTYCKPGQGGQEGLGGGGVSAVTPLFLCFLLVSAWRAMLLIRGRTSPICSLAKILVEFADIIKEMSVAFNGMSWAPAAASRYIDPSEWCKVIRAGNKAPAKEGVNNNPIPVLTPTWHAVCRAGHFFDCHRRLRHSARLHPARGQELLAH